MSTIEQAAKALMAGKLVAFPTETVYGLGADATNQSAVRKIYAVKNRPTDHPLIIHIADQSHSDFWANEIPSYAVVLGKTFWPGPITLIFRRSANAQDFITGGQDSVGLRVPNHPVALELLNEFSRLGGKGIAAPSANRFGKLSPTSAQAVRTELGPYLSAEDIVLDGGDSEVGIESTIIDCSGATPAILRAGFISAEQIEKVTGIAVTAPEGAIRVSGALERHYSPDTPLQLGGETGEGDGFLALADFQTPIGAVRLASPANNVEYAHVLYSALRKADELSLRKVVAIVPTGDYLADAIADRLKKAAAR